MHITFPVPSDFGLASTPHLKINIPFPFPAAVSLPGEWAEGGPAEPGHRPQLHQLKARLFRPSLL